MPFNADPSSEQVLDAFMTHVVARHLRSYCGAVM